MIKPYIKDLVQNYKDAPNLWDIHLSSKSSYVLKNTTHYLGIEIHKNKKVDVYIRENKPLIDVNIFEQAYLRMYFLPKLQLKDINYKVPTKATSPEAFL